MNRLKRLRLKSEIFVVRNPKVLVPIVFCTSLIALVGVETTRAYFYQGSVNSYRQTARVVKLTDSIERLGRAVEENSNALVCSLSTDLLVDTKLSAEVIEDAPEDINREVGELAQQASPAPSFNSAAQFVPLVKKARDTSVALKQSLDAIQSLTSEDERSTYCSELVNVLSEVYFVDTLSTPQGVGALHVAQQENFKKNISLAQEGIVATTPPDIFRDQHMQIHDYLNNLRLSLAGDTNAYELFSREVESDTEVLQTVFGELEDASQELGGRVELLLFHSSVLK